GRLPRALHRPFPAPVTPGFTGIDRLRIKRRAAIVADARQQRDRIERGPGSFVHAGHRRGAQPALATARLAITPTRCARYSALAWISLFSPSCGVAIPAIASAAKLADSAASIAAWRNTPPCPAPVTATRTPPAVFATNTPT